MTEPSTVVLRGNDEIEYKERPAAPEDGEIRPGAFCEYDGGYLQKHASDGGDGSAIFAIERRAKGMVADDPDRTDGQFDEYLPEELVLYGVFDKGHQVYALLAAGSDVTDGDSLYSAGDGTFRAAAGDGSDDGSTAVVQAIEDVNNTGGEPVRVRVEVI